MGNKGNKKLEKELVGVEVETFMKEPWLFRKNWPLDVKLRELDAGTVLCDADNCAGEGSGPLKAIAISPVGYAYCAGHYTSKFVVDIQGWTFTAAANPAYAPKVVTSREMLWNARKNWPSDVKLHELEAGTVLCDADNCMGEGSGSAKAICISPAGYAYCECHFDPGPSADLSKWVTIATCEMRQAVNGVHQKCVRTKEHEEGAHAWRDVEISRDGYLRKVSPNRNDPTSCDHGIPLEKQCELCRLSDWRIGELLSNHCLSRHCLRGSSAATRSTALSTPGTFSPEGCECSCLSCLTSRFPDEDAAAIAELSVAREKYNETVESNSACSHGNRINPREGLTCWKCEEAHVGPSSTHVKIKASAEYGKNPHVVFADPVHRPAHYTQHPSGIECIQVTEHMNFNLGNATKYLWRVGLKSQESAVQDLQKAKWYIEREIARIEGGKKS